MSDKIVKVEPEVAAEYGLSLLKGTISAIPVVGGAINEVLFEARSRLKQERLNQFFQGVAQDVAKLDGEVVKTDFLSSDAFSDIVEDVILKVTRTSSEEKQAHFRRVLLGAFKGQYDGDFGPRFLAILADITEAEIMVLAAVKELPAPQKAVVDPDPAHGGPAIDYKNSPWGLDGALAKQVVQSLVSKGLITDDSYGRWGAVAYTHIGRSELGARFLTWLGLPEADGGR